MQTLTPEFVFTNLRIAFIAVIAYMGGKGYFSPEGVTLATALLTSVLPIAVPWFFSAYMSWGVTKVPLHSVAAEVAKVESVTSNPAMLAEAAKDAASKIAPLLIVCTLAISMAACTTTAGTQSGIGKLTARLCAFVPTVQTIDGIIRTGLTDELAIAKAICDAVAPTQSALGLLLAPVPTVRGVVVRGRFLK